MASPSLSLIHKGRAAKLEKLVANARKNGTETYPVVWRGKREYLPVIQGETDWVLLNLDNGRTRAEQDVRSSQEGDPNLFADPLSEKAQKIQESILRGLDDDAYSELLRDLGERKQKEPAVLTAAGVLVNGNRRCVALRELKVEYISAVVLPDDATPKEIRALEFELQIAKDFREDYGDVNRLLMIERLMQEDKYEPEVIAKRLRMSKEEVLAEKGTLDLMREYIQVVKGAELLGNLKGKYQAFKELYVLVQDTRKSGQFAKAEKIKSNRFLGIMAGAGYRELRHVNDKFTEQYIAATFEKEPDLRGLVAVTAEEQVEVDLGPLQEFNEDTKADKGQVVLDQLVQLALDQPKVPAPMPVPPEAQLPNPAPPDATEPDPASSVTTGHNPIQPETKSPTPVMSGVKLPSASVAGAKLPNPTLARARKAIQEATKDAMQDAKDEKYSGQPLVLLGEATGKLRRINLEKAKAAGSFNPDEFLAALGELRQASEALEAKCKELGGA